MGKIRLKIKSHPPPVTKQKLTLTSPHLLIILRLPPLPCFLPPVAHVGCLPQAQKVLQMTLQMPLLNNQNVIFT